LRVLSYAGDRRPLMTRAVVLLTISVLFSVAPFFLVGVALNSFLGDTRPELWWLLCIAAGVLVCLAIKNFLNGAGLDASHRLAYYTLAGMRRRVAEKMMKMSMGDVQAYGTGPAKKNFVENIEEMELILAHSIPEGIANVLTFFIVVVTMFVMDWRMALAGMVSIALGFIPTASMMADGVKRMGSWYASSEVMTKRIIEYIAGMEVIKVFGQQSRSFKKYSESVVGYRDETLDWYRSSFLHMTSIVVLLTSALLVMLPVGVWLYLSGTLTITTMVLSLLLGMSIGLPAMRMLSFIPQFPMLKQKSQKIEGMFDIPDMPEGTKAAQCHEFILETENGYGTVVGVSGDKLSGGQKQRICIARAMLKDAPIIMLDEATSFADPENEDKIQGALSKLISGKTVIIVAHRLSTIVEADNIVLLAGGGIADQGRHADLLKRCALYKKLWDAHMESMDWDLGSNIGGGEIA
jgi:ATP-binding cassette subfamily B protein